MSNSKWYLYMLPDGWAWIIGKDVCQFIAPERTAGEAWDMVKEAIKGGVV